jgi:diguanylate cyclase (GGDEF)-like protein
MATEEGFRTPAERLEEGLSKLREGFAERLPGRVEELTRQWSDVVAGDWDADLPRAMHRSLHGLAGTAGSLGLKAVADAAGEIEGKLLRLLDRGRAPTPDEATSISHLIETLPVAAAKDHERGPLIVSRDFGPFDPPPVFEPRNLIVVIETGGEFARELAQQLGYFGFELQMFERVDEMKSIGDERRPAAVILDLCAVESEGAGVEAAAGVREALGLEIPVVFVSNRSDVEARLDAVRAACSGYFVKPVNFSEIVTALDRLTRSEPEVFRILIVDDEKEAAEFHAGTLEAADMETVTVVDPNEVTAQLVEFRPDVILMDMYMPTCSGVELAAVIRQEEAFVGVPIIFLSRETDHMKKIAALKQGGDDFLSKPVPPEQLVAAVTARAQRGRTLRQLMERDGLTGLYSHSRIVEQLEAAVRRAARSHGRLAVAMLDIDDFKDTNDEHGHLVGDQVLKALAYLLRQRLRLSDLVGRFGGDEYLVVLPDTDGGAAERIMDDIRSNFAAVEHDTGRASFTVSISCGVAEFPAAQSSHQLIEAADEALYRAKRSGRNRVFRSNAEGH